MFFDVSLYKSPNPQPLSLTTSEARYADGIQWVVRMLQACPASVTWESQSKTQIPLEGIVTHNKKITIRVTIVLYFRRYFLLKKKFIYFTTPQGEDDRKIILSIHLLRI